MHRRGIFLFFRHKKAFSTESSQKLPIVREQRQSEMVAFRNKQRRAEKNLSIHIIIKTLSKQNKECVLETRDAKSHTKAGHQNNSTSFTQDAESQKDLQWYISYSERYQPRLLYPEKL